MSHTHGDSHSSKSRLVWAALSLILLAAGTVIGRTDSGWFENRTVEIIWYIAAFLPVGLPVMKEGWEECLKKDFFNEFVLMSIASVGAFCIGEYPEAVAVMLFYSIGESLQGMAVDRATRNIGALLDVRPERARVLRNGDFVEIPPEEAVPGDIIGLRPGERVPLDGKMDEGEAMFDTSALTGESLPRNIKAGEEVLAGMIVCDKPVRIIVTKPYDQSALARILDLVRDASERKAPAEHFIRKFARVYTPAVILLSALIICVPAVIGATVPSFEYDFQEWLYRGLVFLVISCPCALVISIPLGYFAGIGAASRRGILFKGGNYLDAITKVTDVAFDKTGTLTTGRFHVSAVVHEPHVSEEKLLGTMASAEGKSNHPLAKAIAEHAESRNIMTTGPSSVTEIPGYGIEASVGGENVLVGNGGLLEKHGISVPGAGMANGGTAIYCAIDGKYAGYVLLADTLKEDAKAAVAGLRAAGVENLCMLSGDRQETVRAYAEELGLTEAHGEMLPEDKAAYVEGLSRSGGHTVAFVGDGMNDAPVLAVSDIGIAMGGLGSDAAIESADIVIQTDSPSKIVTALAIGRYTRRIVIQNIVGAISIKMIILLAGAFGFVSLWAAVFADVGVALLAVMNSMRIMAKKF